MGPVDVLGITLSLSHIVKSVRVSIVRQRSQVLYRRQVDQNKRTRMTKSVTDIRAQVSLQPKKGRGFRSKKYLTSFRFTVPFSLRFSLPY